MWKDLESTHTKHSLNEWEQEKKKEGRVKAKDWMGGCSPVWFWVPREVLCCSNPGSGRQASDRDRSSRGTMEALFAKVRLLSSNAKFIGFLVNLWIFVLMQEGYWKLTERYLVILRYYLFYLVLMTAYWTLGYSRRLLSKPGRLYIF